MAEFKTIETQEQLDAIIKERLARQEEKLKERFASYLSPDDITSRTEGLNTQIVELQKALEEERTKSGTYDTQIAELMGKIKTYERNSVKTRVTAELGLPHEMADRLLGETEEEIKADAERLKGILDKSITPAPLASNEGNNNVDNADMRALVRSLKGE